MWSFHTYLDACDPSHTMMEIACAVVKDVSVLRQMLLINANLTQELPDYSYWEVIASFSCLGSATFIDAAAVNTVH